MQQSMLNEDYSIKKVNITKEVGNKKKCLQLYLLQEIQW